MNYSKIKYGSGVLNGSSLAFAPRPSMRNSASFIEGLFTQALEGKATSVKATMKSASTIKVVATSQKAKQGIEFYVTFESGDRQVEIGLTKSISARAFQVAFDDNNTVVGFIAQVFAAAEKKINVVEDEDEDDLPTCDERAEEDDYLGGAYLRYANDSDVMTDEEWADIGREYYQDMFDNGEIDQEELDDALDYYEDYSYEG